VTRAIKKYFKDFISLVVLFLIAVGVSGFIIYNQDARPALPLIEPKPVKLYFEFSDAQAVTPGQGQSVRVAGVQVGKITASQLRNGVAYVETQIEPKWWDKLQVRTDATGLLRPRTGLKDMFIELDPGGEGELVPEGGSIPVENTSPDIDPDEFLSAFDTDTRTYLQLLINGAGKGLDGRGDDLNAVFKRLGPTQRDLNRVTEAIASRREDLKELVHRYGQLTNTLADRDREIKRLVSASEAVFESFANQDANISLAVSRLPGTLAQTERTLTKADAYADLLGPTLEELRPPFRQLATTNEQIIPFMEEAAPITRDRIRPFVRAARPFVNDLRPAARQLNRATPDFVATFHELNRFFNIGALNPNGAEPLYPTVAENNARRDEGYLWWLGWTGMNTASMFSTSDANGAFRRAYFGLSCETIKNQLATNPAAGPLIGIINAINDPLLCGNPANPSPIDIIDLPGVPLPKKVEGGKQDAQATDGAPAAGDDEEEVAPETATPEENEQQIETQGTLPKSLEGGR
jgi:phospholipid/cholesterol/gamma-HCH transport system substrate-binding protein